MGVANSFGATIIKCRQERNWSQDKLAIEAARLGFYLPRMTIANLEAGRVQPKMKHMIIICRVLRIRLVRLFPTEVQHWDDKAFELERKNGRK